MNKITWEHFPHKADMGIRGFGDSIEEAFAQAAVAMSAIITDPENIEQTQMVKIESEGADIEMLLVDWLSSLLYEMDTKSMIFGRFEVVIDGDRLAGKAWGEKINIEKHQPAVEVKGVSYTALEVREQNGTWIAQCVVDV